MTLKRWLPTFLAFPLGGLLAFETVGSVTNAGTAAAAGLLAGAVIGAGQWLALRGHGIDGRWPLVTAAAMAAGSALAASRRMPAPTSRTSILTGAVAGAPSARRRPRCWLDPRGPPSPPPAGRWHG
jgi:hypothetical protein